MQISAKLFKLSFCCLLIIIGAVGCSTHMAPMTYQATTAVAKADSPNKLIVGPFQDQRGTDSNWLGAVRGGYGNPLKKLLTPEPMSNVVEKAFREALRTRDLLGDNDAAYELRGTIQKLDTSEFVNREAHAHIAIAVVDRESNRPVFENTYIEDQEESSWGAGIFADEEHLRQFAEQTLRAAIDRAVDDPGFRTAIAGRPQRYATGLSKRLQELQSLHEQNLISDDEYEAKRQELIREI